MIISSACYNVVTHLQEFVTECGTVGNNLMSIFLVFRLKSFFRAYSLAGDDVLKRTALCIRENSTVNLLCKLRSSEDQATSWTS